MTIACPESAEERPESADRPTAVGPSPAFPGAILGKPTEPWVPKKLVINPVGKSKATRRQGRTVRCWDVRGTVDGWPYFRRFTQPDGTAERARAWAAKLVEDYNRGWAYDPQTRQFLTPAVASDAGDSRPTVLDCAMSFLDRKWDTAWEPRSRQAAARALKRACTHLLRAGAIECPDRSVADYLDVALRPAQSHPDPLPDELVPGALWLSRWSQPIEDVTWEELEALVTRFRTNQRNAGKRVSPATERRFVADLKQFWADASARHRFANPWPAVETMDRSSGRRSARGAQAIDRDLVLSAAQVSELAEACVTHGKWGAEVRCFVLVMGLCGLRPGEAVGLTIDGLDLPADGAGWLTTSRSRRRISQRWLEPNEDGDWGPLKDRDLADSRRAPIPTWLVPLLRSHLEEFRPEAGARNLVFARSGKPIELAVFDREVWRPARAALFPADPLLQDDDPRQPKLSRLRRHDLRHAACSLWLNAGVDVKVCQKWSGHKRLSVFLDIYQGILPGRESEGVTLVEQTLRQQGIVRST